MAYHYHSTVKSRIKKGLLQGYDFVFDYPRIGECLVLYFSTKPYKVPIRPYRYHEYEKYLGEITGNHRKIKLAQ